MGKTRRDSKKHRFQRTMRDTRYCETDGRKRTQKYLPSLRPPGRPPDRWKDSCQSTSYEKMKRQLQSSQIDRSSRSKRRIINFLHLILMFHMVSIYYYCFLQFTLLKYLDTPELASYYTQTMIIFVEQIQLFSFKSYEHDHEII